MKHRRGGIIVDLTVFPDASLHPRLLIYLVLERYDMLCVSGDTDRSLWSLCGNSLLAL